MSLSHSLEPMFFLHAHVDGKCFWYAKANDNDVRIVPDAVLAEAVPYSQVPDAMQVIVRTVPTCQEVFSVPCSNDELTAAQKKLLRIA